MNGAADSLFTASRRLTGANLYVGIAAVVLEPAGPLAADAGAHARWAARLRRLCGALGWQDPQPVVRLREHADGGRLAALAFAAPAAALFTATEVNEWAWERSVTDAWPLDRLAAAGFGLAHPALDDDTAAAAAFAARARREASPPLARLETAAERHGVVCLSDDDTVSLGAGSGSRSWPRAALPLPMDVPWDRLHDVPTVLVTGSNGKTTTTRLLAAIAGAGGRTAGWCSTEGVFAGGRLLAHGDYAGPAGARLVLRDRDVQAALLETARGGLLRRGLALRRADVAVVTNVSEDHLGEYGVASVDDIAEAKLVVAHAVADGGTLVLNAGDEVLMRTADRLPHAARPRRALFAADHDHPLLAASRERAGSGAAQPPSVGAATGRGSGPAAALSVPAALPAVAATCGARDGRLLLYAGGFTHDLGDVAAMPLSVGGAAAYNVGNIAAAALAAHAAGFGIAAIVETLARFGGRPDDNPGRLERWPHDGATVLVDYAHNPEGLTQLLRVARALRPRRLGLLLGQAGNRDDAAIRELARAAAAFAPDCIVVKELPGMLRGRAAGEVPALIEAELDAAGLPPHGRRLREPDEEAAARWLLGWARPGDVVVLPLHTGAVRQRVVAMLEGSAARSG